jgi:predicted nucleic acid-binding Zn ribbon protein
MKMSCANCGAKIPMQGTVCQYCGADKTKAARTQATVVLIVLSFILVGVMLLFVALFVARALQPKKPYEYIYSRAGDTWHMVYVPPEHADDMAVYLQAVEDLCGPGDGFCKVMFWNDRDMVWPEGQPMTDAQANAWCAQYLRNPSAGINQFSWIRNGTRVDVGAVEF